MIKNSIFFVLLLAAFIYPQEKYFLTSDSVKLYINVKGNGTPCLYLHGGPGADSYFFEKSIGDSLEKHFRMIYLDQRGCGRSESPKDKNYSMDRMVKDFEEIREYLGIKQWVTIGHSFGGVLQMGYAKQHPEVIEGMIMINCTINVKESFTKSWFPKACEFLNITDTKFYFDDNMPIKMRLDSLVSQLIHKEIIWKMPFALPEDAVAIHKIYSGMPRGNKDFENVALSIKDYLYDFQKESNKMQMPVLYFYGDKDWCVGPGHYKNIKFPKLTLWKTDFAHMSPFLENKRGELMNAVRSYLHEYIYTSEKIW